ncbi:unnamed protein product [Owenia fusiformis]|uniref:Uncharacterized protein n=1 Tax=Owenia fusiformis TaxID=6347 RepID=A0A8J1XM23_OWEFU|nr:unnamed protein product [Owenia fusiformis]
MRMVRVSICLLLTLMPHLINGQSTNKSNDISCELYPVSDNVKYKVQDLVRNGIHSLEYKIHLKNSSHNALTTNTGLHYRLDTWRRVTQQGESLLKLSFNYRALSFNTLGSGVDKLNVAVYDSPSGCLRDLEPDEKYNTVRKLLIRDLDPDLEKPSLGENEQLCHQIVTAYQNTGRANFADLCCSVYKNGKVHCKDVPQSALLWSIMVLMIFVKTAAFIFGPLFIPAWLYTFERHVTSYIVKLNQSVEKLIYLGNDRGSLKYQHRIDFYETSQFNKFQEGLRSVPKNKTVKIRINELRVAVSGDRLVSESRISLGLFDWLYDNLFRCGIRNKKPFRACCRASILGDFKKDFMIRWKHFCLGLSILFAVFLLLPLPFYIRLGLYCDYEREEIIHQKEFIKENNLLEQYRYHLLQYFSPDYGLFPFIYVMYFVFCMIFIYITFEQTGRFRSIIRDAFTDLHSMCSSCSALTKWAPVLLYPCKHYGILGLLLCLVLWIIVLPCVLIGCLVLFAPIIYLTYRVGVHTLRAVKGDNELMDQSFSQRALLDGSVCGTLPSNKADTDLSYIEMPKPPTFGLKILYVLFALLFLFCTYLILIVFAECVGFGLEMAIYTILGIIMNANYVLRYVIFVVLLFMYAYLGYNSVYKVYMAVNKRLFREIADRSSSEVSDVTRLPEYLQDNHAFKVGNRIYVNPEDEGAAEDYSTNQKLNWTLRNTVLFIFKNDLHFIPKGLLSEVCKIEVGGSPGPIYKTIFRASIKFLCIVFYLLFVLLTVVLFGRLYPVSSTNQVLSILLCGLIPMFIRLTCFRRPAASVPTQTFTSKIGEVLSSYEEDWPIADLPFEIVDIYSDKNEADIFIELPCSRYDKGPWGTRLQMPGTKKGTLPRPEYV